MQHLVFNSMKLQTKTCKGTCTFDFLEGEEGKELDTFLFSFLGMASLSRLPTFVTFITTNRYAEGAICLAQSLLLYGVSTPVLLIQATPPVLPTLKRLAERDLPPGSVEIANIFETREGDDSSPSTDVLVTTDVPENENTHNGAGARLEFDSPRRQLFAAGTPFIYLDADLLCVSPPMDALADVFAQLKKDAGARFSIGACPAFRLKKKQYGSADKGFNAGVIVCSQGIKREENDRIMSEIERTAEEAARTGKPSGTTEERILSQVFKDRWLPMDAKFNLIKRVWKHAPALWTELKGRAVFLHYMGAKPWMLTDKEKQQADWDYDGYDILENIWHKVRRNEFKSGDELTEAFRSLAGAQ